MNNGFRIPTVLAILLVGGFVALLSVFSDDARVLLGRAATPAGTIPQTVEIVNVTDTSAVVFWKSTTVVASTLSVPSISSTFYDVRDTDSLAKPYTLHMYLVHSLPSGKATSFEIKTGNQTVYKGAITTGPPLTTVPQAVPLYGSAPEEVTGNSVFIKANLNDEVTAMTYTTTPTNWALPLSSLRTSDLENYYCSDNKCDSDLPLTLTFMTEEKVVEKKTTVASARPYGEEAAEDESVLSSTSVISPTTTAVGSPTPTKKILPTQTKQKTTPSPTKTQKITPTVTKTLSKTVLGATEKNTEIEITSPTEGQALSFVKPLIRGIGISGKEVTITISGQVTQIGKTKVTDKNTWQWNPAYPLTPGRYTLKIETSDKIGKKVTQSRSFMILKSGESVLSASTPSATLIPFPTDTPTPTTIVDVPTATPTIFVTAGPEVSLFFIGGGTLLLLFALALL